jgi:hypothetical protein
LVIPGTEYLYVVTDMQGHPLGDTHLATEESFSIPIIGLPTATVRLRVDDPLGDEILARDCAVLLKIYQDVGTRLTADISASTGTHIVPVTSTAGWDIGARSGSGLFLIDAELVKYDVVDLTPTSFYVTRAYDEPWSEPAVHKAGARVMPIRFYGECTDYEEDGSPGQYVNAFNFAGPFERLQNRVIGRDFGGGGVAFNTGRDAILTQTLADVNTESEPVGGDPVRSFTGILPGKVDPVSAISTDAMVFKPLAEFWSELAQTLGPIPFEAISSPDVYDHFTGVGLLTSHTPNTNVAGGTWSEDGSVGSGGSYQLRTSGLPDYPEAVNTVGSDNWADIGSGNNLTNGKIAFVGPSKTTMLVQAQINHQDATMGTPPTHQGIIVRCTDWNKFFAFSIYEGEFPGQQQFRVWKRTGGGAAASVWASGLGDIIYDGMGGGTVRLLVTADGVWAVWWFPNVWGAPLYGILQSGYDPDLATSGPLASGKGGIYKLNASPDAVRLSWKEFYVGTPTQFGGEPCAWELEPCETRRSSAYLWPQIAKLNVSSYLGTDRPHAIFEFGDGARGIARYNRKITRQGRLTRAYSLPDTEKPWAAGQVAHPESQPEWSTIGLHEAVVPMDIKDATARAAIAQLHVDVRKKPREVVTFDPSSLAPIYGIDYDVGDTVVGRGRINGQERWAVGVSNPGFRVYAVDVTRVAPGRRHIATPRLIPT